MRTIVKIFFLWLGLSILMMFFWMLGLMTGNILIPDALIQQSDASGADSLILLFITCLLNTGVILLFIYNTECAGFRLASILFLLTFGIMYLLSQIETLWFNQSVKMPVRGVFMLLIAGVVELFLFSLAATWLTGRFRYPGKRDKPAMLSRRLPGRLFLLIVIVWPAIYFLAGYFIAWQFRAVREYYSGAALAAPFVDMMKENFGSGLYFFQIFRGLLWVLIAWPVLSVIKGDSLKKGVLLGLLFTVLGSAQLLIPNPYMPEPVRMAHLLETAVSDFIWGVIIAMILFPSRPEGQKNG